MTISIVGVPEHLNPVIGLNSAPAGQLFIIGLTAVHFFPVSESKRTPAGQ